MIFDNILFHNVEEMEHTGKGYLLRRVCHEARNKISEGVQDNCFSTGVELRFKMIIPGFISNTRKQLKNYSRLQMKINFRLIP